MIKYNESCYYVYAEHNQQGGSTKHRGRIVGGEKMQLMCVDVMSAVGINNKGECDGYVGSQVTVSVGKLW